MQAVKSVELKCLASLMESTVVKLLIYNRQSTHLGVS